MELFLVTRHGVYMRGVVGIYTDEESAKLAVDRARGREPDEYHEFKVHPITTNDDVCIGIAFEDGVAF